MGNVLEVKTMNRQQRRAHQRNVDWINSLSKDKQEIINRVIEDKAKKMAREGEQNGLCMLLDQVATTIVATLIALEDYVEESYIENFLDTFNEFLKENINYVTMEGNDWKVKLKEAEPKVLKLIESLLKEGVTKKTLVKEVRKEFPKLTSGQIFNAFKIVQDKLKTLSTEDAVEYIFAEEKQKEVVEEVSENVEKEIKNMKIKGQAIPKNLEVKGLDVKGVLNAKVTEIELEEKRTKKEIEILSKRLNQISKDREKLSKVNELLKDIDL